MKHNVFIRHKTASISTIKSLGGGGGGRGSGHPRSRGVAPPPPNRACTTFCSWRSFALVALAAAEVKVVCSIGPEASM